MRTRRVSPKFQTEAGKSQIGFVVERGGIAKALNMVCLSLSGARRVSGSECPAALALHVHGARVQDLAP